MVQLAGKPAGLSTAATGAVFRSDLLAYCLSDEVRVNNEAVIVEHIENKSANSIPRATHMMKSWLRSMGIPFAAEGSNIVVNGVPVTFGKPGKNFDGIAFKPSDITSPDPKVVFETLHKVTEAAGFGRPMPVDRGEMRSENVTYHDHYEDIYLRHRHLYRTPNPAPEDVAKYRHVVRRAAEKAFFRFNLIATSVGFEVDDLYNIGLLHLGVFLHHYAYEDDEKNFRICSAFLRQRFEEWAGTTAKKAANATCLVEMMHHTDDEGIDPMLFVPADVPSSDAEYEVGEYVMERLEDGKVVSQHFMSVESDGLLGVSVSVDGVRLSSDEAEEIGDLIRLGTVRILGPINFDDAGALDESDEPGEVSSSRRRAARKELEERLLAMEPEQRKLVLAMAALNKEVDPEVRREARRLCRDRYCHDCALTTVSESCLRCEKPTVLKYGVDPDQFREEMEAAGDALAEVFVKKTKHEKVEKARIERAKKAKEAGKVVEISKEEMAKLVEAARKECFENMSDEQHCPKCNSIKHKSEFGIRVPKDKATGLPKKAIRQSYCKQCRT